MNRSEHDYNYSDNDQVCIWSEKQVSHKNIRQGNGIRYKMAVSFHYNYTTINLIEHLVSYIDNDQFQLNERATETKKN